MERRDDEEGGDTPTPGWDVVIEEDRAPGLGVHGDARLDADLLEGVLEGFVEIRAVLVRPVDGTTIRAVLGVGRWSGVQPSLSATVGPGRRFRLTVGYEAATDALKCAFAVEVRGFTCAAGFDYHPVLGRRQGVSLTWGR